MLIITGAMGAGKSSVLAEASDILTLQRMVHAAIDVDVLGLAYLSPSAQNDEVLRSNLRSICANYASVGVTRFLLARALETRAELDFCRSVVCASNTLVCRLITSIETLQRRVKNRELGVARQDYISRAANLNQILDRVRLEDFSVISENRPLTEVAREMLLKAGWISELESRPRNSD